MIQEEKELLLRDLSARLPYGVMCHIEIPHSFIEFVEKGDLVLNSITSDTLKCGFKSCWGIELKFIKPYLRPISSMTEKEKEEFEQIRYNAEAKLFNAFSKGGFTLAFHEIDDWLNSKHFDYRGLIGLKLALEAPEGMYVL